MKTILRYLITISVLLVLSYLIYGVYTEVRLKEKAQVRWASLPDITFYTIERKKITKEDVSGKALWLVFFDTNCEYCRMEIENILNAGKLRDIRIWLVSSEPLDSLSAFARKYKLDSLPHIQILNDTHHAAYLTFNVTSSPASFLYGSNGALINQYKGVVKVETVLKDYAGAKL